MADEFLSRWSRLKHEARAKAANEVAPPTTEAQPPVPSQDAMRDAPAEAPLPPVDSLTPESDFTPFMKKDVDAGTRREALRTLFSDERFNVMDGLDVYIDDYSKPDPMPEEWLGKLEQLARLGHHPDPKPEEAQADGEQVSADRKERAETSPGIEAAQAAEGPKPLNSTGEFAPPSDTPG